CPRTPRRTRIWALCATSSAGTPCTTPGRSTTRSERPVTSSRRPVTRGGTTSASCAAPPDSSCVGRGGTPASAPCTTPEPPAPNPPHPALGSGRLVFPPPRLPHRAQEAAERPADRPGLRSLVLPGAVSVRPEGAPAPPPHRAVAPPAAGPPPLAGAARPPTARPGHRPRSPLPPTTRKRPHRARAHPDHARQHRPVRAHRTPRPHPHRPLPAPARWHRPHPPHRRPRPPGRQSARAGGTPHVHHHREGRHPGRHPRLPQRQRPRRADLPTHQLRVPDR